MRSHAAAPHSLARHHTRRRNGRHFFGHLFTALADRFLLLPIGAIVALQWANAAPESYFRFSVPLAFYVNEIGMALFFALITQEVVEALMPGGALHSWRRWSVALAGAAGGIAGSAGLFLALVHYNYETVGQFLQRVLVDPLENLEILVGPLVHAREMHLLLDRLRHNALPPSPSVRTARRLW